MVSFPLSYKNLSWAIVEFTEDARHETYSRSILLQMSHNAADSVILLRRIKFGKPEGFQIVTILFGFLPTELVIVFNAL